MKKCLVLAILFALAFMALAPASVAVADSESHSYQLHMEHPNVSEASNGDRVAVTGGGTFSTHPDSVTASGTFTHTTASGALMASGTWTATDLIEFQSYGCGVVLGNPISPNACGGALKLRVHLTATAPASIAGLQADGILTIFCIIGPNPPNNHDDPTGEGITLVVQGFINFNKIVSGMNVYIKTS
ncbi:MAG: hypothetical protein E6I40_02580 [Chloroflexi bacterium]|nr:MAG: hypothetical protein E6I40_02580 [Chloroflexota bacterium]